ncbi:MAG: nuclear transport factor 2 family protein [Actinomycetota bacterium]
MADLSNIELLRRGFEIYEREGAEGLLPLADPEIEIYTQPGLMNAGTDRGHEGFLRWSEQWLEAWEEFRIEPKEFIEVGGSIVVVPIRQAATGRGSGVRVGNDITYLVEIRGGKVTRFHVYQETEGALEAAKRLAAEP